MNCMYRLSQLKLNIGSSVDDLKKKLVATLKINAQDIDWTTFKILKKSIDARDKNNIFFVYNVAFDFVKSDNFAKGIVAAKKKLEKYEPMTFDPEVLGLKDEIAREGTDRLLRPIVVGFGPAGIFASYIFALNGIKPIIYERGKALDERVVDTKKFFDTMELDEESNVCFGEGGAGAFSDGKLNTNNKDRDGIYKFILETFVKFGADEKILYENMPHIGTDKLIDVIKNMRDEIVRLGGEIHYNSKWSYEEMCSQRLSTQGTPIILAIGNSARDTFRDLLKNGFNLKAKTIAVGYRIAHKQAFIDNIQYGMSSHNSPLREGLQSSSIQKNVQLPPAIYKLTCDVGGGRSVYSFCMCPGGYIINSSNKKDMFSINGMSYNDRSGKYANSAIVVTVKPEDIEGSHSSPLRESQHSTSLKEVPQCSPLQMIEFQERVEKKAYELEKGYIPFVTNDENINMDEIFKGQAKESGLLFSVYENVGVKFDINECIKKALAYFNKKMCGFYSDAPIAVLAGVETRTSSPVLLERDENYMCNVENFYPCGEGLGHGGGIMSSAADGVRVAMKILQNIMKK